MFICFKCGKEFKSKGGLGNHIKHCGINYKYSRSKRSVKWICPLCNQDIKSRREEHLKYCNGRGKRRLRPKDYTHGGGWNKGKTYEEIYGGEKALEIKLKLCKNYKKGCITEEKNKERIIKIKESIKNNRRNGGFRNRSGRGKSGWYRGIWCQSSWELAFVIYNLEHGIKFKRNTNRFEYVYNGKKLKYIPDFIDGYGNYIEVKGYITEQTLAKIYQFPESLIIINKIGIKLYLKYVKSKYGKDFINLYET